MIFERQSVFVTITKRLCIQLKQTRERPQTYYKNRLVSGNYFVIILARMVQRNQKFERFPL